MAAEPALPPARVRAYGPAKRALDLAAALAIGAVVAGPMALVAIAIKLDSPGPVLFRQPRAGRHHRPFTIYKFRTMRSGTPSLSTEEMRARGLSPFTRTGPFLRRTSLDELPQLWNILRGEMSFIGPRPALLSQRAVLEGRERRGVEGLAPGITGLAQATGRDDLPDEEKVRRDAEYLENFGLAQDLRILWLTLRALLTAEGAH